MDGLAEDESCRFRLPKSVQEEDSLLVQSNPTSMFNDYHLHYVQSLEEKLEDLASLSQNY